MTAEVRHSTYIGHRGMRDATGRMVDMPFARCHRGWDGPGRTGRAAAVQDGIDHLSAAAAADWHRDTRGRT